jgi:hypothetical protein
LKNLFPFSSPPFSILLPLPPFFQIRNVHSVYTQTSYLPYGTSTGGCQCKFVLFLVCYYFYNITADCCDQLRHRLAWRLTAGWSRLLIIAHDARPFSVWVEKSAQLMTHNPQRQVHASLFAGRTWWRIRCRAIADSALLNISIRCRQGLPG